MSVTGDDPDQFYNFDLCQLNDTAKDLRILEIISNDSKIVECKLGNYVETEGYSALSWCWGSPSPGSETPNLKPIRIFHDNKPFRFEVSTNLESALRHLRRRKILRVWVDAVCINQRDNDEKNNQVPMMAKIYGDADLVYVWLGGEENRSKEAIKFIQNRVLNLNDFDDLVKDKRTSKEWNALLALMQRDWFSRRWIVQEIALAKDAVILCGNDSIKWLDFADAISLFNEVEARTRGLSEIMRAEEAYGHLPNFFGHAPSLSATRLVEVTNNLFRRRNDNEREALLSLEYLVSTFTAFNASQARDTI
jgi:hypothetical protein